MPNNETASLVDRLHIEAAALIATKGRTDDSSDVRLLREAADRINTLELEALGAGIKIDDLEREAAEALARQGEWRPIETAPRDGTRIDVWNGERVPDVSWCRPDGGSMDYKDWCVGVPEVDGCSVSWCMENIHPNPTHWMPLPASPIPPVGEKP